MPKHTTLTRAPSITEDRARFQLSAAMIGGIGGLR